MTGKFGHTVRALTLAGVAAVALLPAAALAQDAVATTGPDAAEPQADPQVEADPSQIIVTGTLVRGVAPPGASPISVSEAAIEATGATTVAQVLQTIPQLGSFGNLQVPLGASPEVSVNRPNLRSLPGFNTAGGSSTLVLLDGHRIVGMGSTTTTPDPDVIPPGVLQRLEIVPDGGSAIYGSDAVAGVLNFITISRFDGVKLDASYGFADDYYRYDANVTAGRDWGSGSLFFSYNYAKGDELVGIDRDFAQQFPDRGNGRLELQCSPGNVQAAGIFYAQPNVTPNTLNQCDGSDFASIYPAYQRHSVFAGLTQELSDSLKIELRAFYTDRDTEILSGPYRFTAQVSAAQARAPYAALGAQTVFGQFGPNDAAQLDVGLEAWGVTPTITADLNGNFQLRVLASHGESTASRRGNILDNTALSTLVANGSFNPYNPASATQTTLDLLTNVENFGRTRQYLDNVRAVVDGDLFELPAGAVKIAVGAEYSNEKFVAQNGSTVPGFENGGFTGNGVNTVTPRIPIFSLGRNIKSAFGEIIVPVLGGGDGPELTLSAAGRYDDYNDVGDTFNPRFGATFKPIEWLSIRGAYGKSFNAPSLADDPRASATDIFFLPSIANGGFRPPADLVANGTYPAFRPNTGILAIRGNAPGITPQKAKTYTAGFDVDPPFIPGLSFGATYYNIDYKDFIGLPPFQDADALYRFNGNVIRTTFTQADINAILVQDTDGVIAPFGSANPFGGAFGSATVPGTYAIFDARKRNFGSVKLDGVDFRANYRTETGFGAVFFNVNGTYDLNREQKNGANAPFIDILRRDNSRFRSRSTLGAELGNLLGQVTWNHLAGYDFSSPQGFNGTTLASVSPASPARTFVGQTSIGSFNTIDLFFRYEVTGSGLTEDLSFTLNVENAFDQDPPAFRGNVTGAASGIRNGNTIGRFIRFGVSKKF